jgi:CheY-like chemotaxis protein
LYWRGALPFFLTEAAVRTARRKAPDQEASPERRTGIHRRVSLDRAPLVLLVDDSEDNRALYATYFEQLELRVEHAVDGEHALFKVMQFSPDVVVMDLGMPVLDGWKAIQQMKSHPKMRTIPVIALTGHATEENIERAHAAGADEVLLKPCTPEELHAVIRELLDDAPLRDD